MTRPGTFQRGNKAGRGQKHNRFITQALVSHLMEQIDDPETATKKGVKALRVRAARVHFLVRKLCELAMEGDTTALKMIMDRVEGTAIQTVEFQGLEDSEKSAMEERRLAKVHEKVKEKSFDELAALYQETLSAGSPTRGSA